MKFRLYELMSPLRGYIEKMWVFESEKPLPDDDMKLIVPNGKLLLVIPFKNGLIGQKDEKKYLANPNKMSLAGISNSPTVVNSKTQDSIGTIGVEINPIGAYRFFHLKLDHVKDELNDLTDLLGKVAGIIEQRMMDQKSVEGKVQVLQHFMCSLLIEEEKDALFEYCIQKIETTRGLIKVGELENETGYSSRWLNMKFRERLGMSPKTLSSIIRFQQYYQPLIANKSGFITRKTFYDHYYDQSHFIKEFKKFTGYSPSTLIKSNNNFGRMFYEE